MVQQQIRYEFDQKMVSIQPSALLKVTKISLAVAYNSYDIIKGKFQNDSLRLGFVHTINSCILFLSIPIPVVSLHFKTLIHS